MLYYTQYTDCGEYCESIWSPLKYRCIITMDTGSNLYTAPDSTSSVLYKGYNVVQCPNHCQHD